MIRRNIQLGDPREEQRIVTDLVRRYHVLMAKLRKSSRAEGAAITADADQLRQEALRRIERLPPGMMRDHLMRKLLEG
jgi:C4-dicarboxylate-specific signal transduction histidine kinase